MSDARTQHLGTLPVVPRRAPSEEMQATTTGSAPYEYDEETGWSAYGRRWRSHHRTLPGRPQYLEDRFAEAGIRWYLDPWDKLHVECLPDPAYELLSGQPGQFHVGYIPPAPTRSELVDVRTIAHMIGGETGEADVNALLEAEGLLKRNPRLKPTAAADGLYAIEVSETGRGHIRWSVDVMYALVDKRGELERRRNEEVARRNRPVRLAVRFPATCAECKSEFQHGEDATWRAVAVQLLCLTCESQLTDSDAGGS